MASTKIPKAHRLGFEKIISISDDALKELLTLLDTTEPSLKPEKLTSDVGAKLTLTSREDFGVMLRLLISLYQAYFASEVSAAEFAEGICKTVEKSEADSLKLDEYRRKLLLERLTKLLSFEHSLGITSKALDVLTENERLLLGARVLSDVRPVFEKTELSTSAAVIVHMLKISYQQNGEQKDFYVALDTNDLSRMKEVLARAEKKAEAIKLALKKANLTYLDVN